MSLIAKPVINKQFWILQDNDSHRKVGNVEACDGGFQVKINNRTEQFKTIRSIEKTGKIHFESPVEVKSPKLTHNVHGYPTASKPHNPVWNVPMKLPLYTKNAESKSWIAAGWYCLKQGKRWETVQDPKLILLQRYEYSGPYYNRAEAVASFIRSKV
jgi:hypothetical protein